MYFLPLLWGERQESSGCCTPSGHSSSGWKGRFLPPDKASGDPLLLSSLLPQNPGRLGQERATKTETTQKRTPRDSGSGAPSLRIRPPRSCPASPGELASPGAATTACQVVLSPGWGPGVGRWQTHHHFRFSLSLLIFLVLFAFPRPRIAAVPSIQVSQPYSVGRTGWSVHPPSYSEP